MLCKTAVETFFFKSCIFWVDNGGHCAIHNIINVVQKSHCQIKLETAEMYSLIPPSRKGERFLEAVAAITFEIMKKINSKQKWRRKPLKK